MGDDPADFLLVALDAIDSLLAESDALGDAERASELERLRRTVEGRLGDAADGWEHRPPSPS